DIARHDRILRIAEITLEPSLSRRFLERGVHLIDGHLAIEDANEVADTSVRHRHAQRGPVELSFQLGDRERSRLGRARRSGNDVYRGRAPSPQVLVNEVE